MLLALVILECQNNEIMPGSDPAPIYANSRAHYFGSCL